MSAQIERNTQLIEGRAKLPPLEGYANVRELADEMLAQKQLAVIPSATDPALTPGGHMRWTGIWS